MGYTSVSRPWKNFIIAVSEVSRDYKERGWMTATVVQPWGVVLSVLSVCNRIPGTLPKWGHAPKLPSVSWTSMEIYSLIWGWGHVQTIKLPVDYLAMTIPYYPLIDYKPMAWITKKKSTAIWENRAPRIVEGPPKKKQMETMEYPRNNLFKKPGWKMASITPQIYHYVQYHISRLIYFIS